jgi:hypothetical protein
MKLSEAYLQCQDKSGRLGGVAGSVVLYVISTISTISTISYIATTLFINSFFNRVTYLLLKIILM